jgi:cell division inhibitor SepF
MAGVWRKTLVYLGLVEDDEYDDYGYEDLEMEEAQPRRAARRAPAGEAADGGGNQREAVVRAMPNAAPQARFHLVMPSSFNDAQEVGDKFREGYSVLMNLQGVDPDLARRLVDFASGLAYGLAGSMQPVAEKVFLITPSGIQVSAEERRRFLEERGFFNQA